MRRWRLPVWGLAAWALLSCACAHAEAPSDLATDAAEAVLDSCVARVGDDAGAAVLKLCPRVPAALRALGYDQLLDSGWPQRLSGISVRQLRDLSRRYRRPALSDTPPLTLLPRILQEMRRAQTPHSWWQSFKERLRRWFQLPSAGGGPWLAQLLSAIPPFVLRLLLYGTTAAVLAMALWTVWRELIVSGVLERRPGAQESGAALGNGAAPGSAELGPADVEAAPAGQRAAVLLQLLLQALRRAGRVRAERALSCRELIEQVSFDSVEQRQRFGAVARWAERERYAIDAGAGEPAGVLAQGRMLYAELQESPPAGASR